jgi:pectin methylesterase-like acyl-CoA thioesterase
LYFNASGTFISRDTNWISSQDTLQVKGDTWFNNCLVAGDVDFIWGAPLVGLFENCEIRTRVDPTAANGPSYAVQSRGVAPNPGFIFLNSRFTAEIGVVAGKGYLGRTQSGNFDPIVFTNCVVGPHIAPAGFFGTSGTTAPTDVTGLRYYNLTDGSGGTWVPSGSTTPFFALTPAQNTALYADHVKIYSASSVSDGGSPANTYTSIFWSLSTTY